MKKLLVLFLSILMIFCSVQVSFAEFIDYDLPYVYVYEEECMKNTVEEEYENAVLVRKTEKVYDAKGHYTSEKQYELNYETNELELTSHIEYTYNEDGRNIGWEYFVPNKDGETLLQKCVITFNGEEREELIYLIEDGKEVLIEKEISYLKENTDEGYTRYKLASNGELVLYSKQDDWDIDDYYTSESYLYEDNGELSDAFKMDCHEDKENRTITYDSYSYNFEKKEFFKAMVTTEVYDEHNNMISSSTKFLDDEDYNDEEKCEYTYDELGRITKSTRTLSNFFYGGDTVIESEYEYDGYNHLVKLVDYFVDDGEKTLFTSEEYFYDEKGFLTQKKEISPEYFDGVHDTVYEGTFSHAHLEKVSGKKPTKEEAGWADYYYCKCCEKYYKDSAGKELIPDLYTWQMTEGKVEYEQDLTLLYVGIGLVVIVAVLFLTRKKK